MKLSMHGKTFSRKVEVQNISKFGVWLYINGKEFFLPYERHPWFKNATVSQIVNIEFLLGHHHHWPELDVFLELDSLEHPERYPLIAKWPHPQLGHRRKKAA